jgi:hypothetical protein
VDAAVARAQEEDHVVRRYAQACAVVRRLRQERDQTAEALGVARARPDAQLRDPTAFSQAFAEVVRLEKLLVVLAKETAQAGAETLAAHGPALEQLRALAVAAVKGPVVEDRELFEAVVTAAKKWAVKLPAVPRSVRLAFDPGKLAEAAVAALALETETEPEPRAEVRDPTKPSALEVPPLPTVPTAGVPAQQDTVTHHTWAPRVDVQVETGDPNRMAPAPPGTPETKIIGMGRQMGR